MKKMIIAVVCICLWSNGAYGEQCISECCPVIYQEKDGPCSASNLLRILKKVQQFLPEESCPPNTLCQHHFMDSVIDLRSEAQKLRDEADKVEQQEKDSQEIYQIIRACVKDR